MLQVCGWASWRGTLFGTVQKKNRILTEKRSSADSLRKKSSKAWQLQVEEYKK